MDLVSIWFEFNRLSLNCDKTKFMLFGTSQKCAKFDLTEVTINSQTIQKCDKMKYLGIVLDPQLTFHKHIEYLQSKIIPKVQTLGKIAPIVKQSTALMVYKTLIMPIMEYGDVIFDCLSARDVSTPQKLQNSCLKHVLQLPRLTPTAYIHEKLDVEYLLSRRSQHVATQMFRISNKLAPKHVCDLFVSRSEISSRVTRSSCKLNYEIPRRKLEMTKRVFVYRGSKLWYDVPYELKTANNPKSFRTELAKVWKRGGDVGVT